MIRTCTAIISAAAAILPALLLSTVPAGAQSVAQRVTAVELNTMIARNQAVVVDVRDLRDWNRSDQKIKGAVRLDPENPDPASLPIAKNATLVLY